MAKITGHSYINCKVQTGGLSYDGLMAQILYNEDEINPPSLTQRIKNSKSAFYHPSYKIPETSGGRRVVGVTRDVRFWPHIGSYYLPDSLIFIPLSAFRECLDKKTGVFTMPSIYSNHTWRVDNYRKVIRSFYDFTYETKGLYWSCKELGDQLLTGIKFDGAYNKETAKIIENEFYTIPHENGKELEREWSTCFVRDDIEKLILNIGYNY